MSSPSLRILACAALALAVFPPVASAQGDSARGMARVMTPREREESGISRLTSVERQHLDGWLLRYTAEIARQLRHQDSAVPQSEREDRATNSDWPLAHTRERWLERPTVPGLVRLDHTLASGDFVQLSDGTIWSIYLTDRPAAVNWRAGDLIVVRQSSIGYGEYDHVLTNNSDGSRAFARLGGPPAGIERPR